MWPEHTKSLRSAGHEVIVASYSYRVWIFVFLCVKTGFLENLTCQDRGELLPLSLKREIRDLNIYHMLDIYSLLIPPSI